MLHICDLLPGKYAALAGMPPWDDLVTPPEAFDIAGSRPSQQKASASNGFETCMNNESRQTDKGGTSDRTADTTCVVNT